MFVLRGSWTVHDIRAGEAEGAAMICEYCGGAHEGKYNCPRIEAVEYRKDGSVKRVVLKGGSSTSFLPIAIQPSPMPPYIIGDPPPSRSTTVTVKGVTCPWDYTKSIVFVGDEGLWQIGYYSIKTEDTQ